MSIARASADGAHKSIALGDEFPIVCEACLGPNPYVRMMRTHNAKPCRISDTPFASFRWKDQRNRWRETVIAPEVARAKNVCQVCIKDLEYGVDAHVRDHVMAALDAQAPPTSDANRDFYWANTREKLAGGAGSGETSVSSYCNLRANVDCLKAFAALEPGHVVRDHNGDGAPATADEQARRRERRTAELRPPDDESARTLHVGGVPPSCRRDDLLPTFLEFGEVEALELDSSRACAFVTFSSRESAETACRALQHQLRFRSTQLRLSWSRKRGRSGVGGEPKVDDEPDGAKRRAVGADGGGGCVGAPYASMRSDWLGGDASLEASPEAPGDPTVRYGLTG